jgi:regulator of protease activity HflC (stomatin/prohibitin superfamily)
LQESATIIELKKRFWLCFSYRLFTNAYSLKHGKFIFLKRRAKIMEYHSDELKKQGAKIFKSAAAGAVVAIVALVVVATFGWINVAPSEVAVEVNKLAGKVNEMPRGVGYHFFNRWITDMVVYKVAARSFPHDSMATDAHANEWNMSLKTNDGQKIDVDMTIIYSLNAKDVPSLHQTIGPTYEDQILLPQIRSEARIAIGQYSAEQMYQGKVREEIQSQIKEKLTQALAKYPAINIQDALMRDFKFEAEFQKAIEQKKLAAQNVEVNKNRALSQEQEALRVEAEARGEKLKAIQQAQGRAESMKVEADAQRYKLEQEAAGQLAKYKADAEGKRLSAEALGGGANVVALEFAKNIPDKLQIWGIPVGQNNTSLMDLSGVFKGMLEKKQ